MQADELVEQATGIKQAPSDDPDHRRRSAAAADAEQNVLLKNAFARWILSILAGQLLLTNLAFFLFGVFSGWQVSDAVMLGWMGGTVVEVIGIVLVVVKNLFPSQDGN